jgi:hypothetical protein
MLDHLAAILCAGIIESQAYQACVKSIEAASIQSGISDTERKMEKYTQDWAHKNTGPTEQRIIGAMGGAYQIISTKTLIIEISREKLPIRYWGSVALEFKPSSAMVKFRWNF